MVLDWIYKVSSLEPSQIPSNFLWLFMLKLSGSQWQSKEGWVTWILLDMDSCSSLKSLDQSSKLLSAQSRFGFKHDTVNLDKVKHNKGRREVNLDKEPSFEGFTRDESIKADWLIYSVSENEYFEKIRKVDEVTTCVEDWMVHFARLYKDHVGF
ncbi:octicosapeptide/Phox/Bem1p (PB1) domain-containing protein [Artemisia annua]|uniref:Octicosapeptide/Phox/Bem1p (PB1) domain-containing protein n=1 Tax=Artemisia annua TaxID=35608 RepID=A0A2U1KNQ7_ARTAN|nr:octicosapeptide/Phox/Bem1p (PB1) domain-containing protein [Artemisia annua]